VWYQQRLSDANAKDNPERINALEAAGFSYEKEF
jgi:hypothetical protein